MSHRSRIAVTLLVAATLICAGCVGQAGTTQDRETLDAPTRQAPAATGATDPDAKSVLMLGRSVMGGWFRHWGWDGAFESLPITQNGYSLTYQELAPPPDIAQSAVDFMEKAPEGSIVFFKFCFDDFPGGPDSVTRFAEQREWIEQIAETATKREQRLIVGNALPKVVSATDAGLIAEHREFNAWLDSYAAGSGGVVRAYDLYGVLAGPDGALRPGYATSPDDSHPNESAYAALDRGLFDLFDAVGE